MASSGTDQAKSTAKLYNRGFIASVIACLLSIIAIVAFNAPKDTRPSDIPAEFRVPDNKQFHIFSDPPGAEVAQENGEEPGQSRIGPLTGESKPYNLADFKVKDGNVTFFLNKQGYVSQKYTVPTSDLAAGIWPPTNESVAILKPASFWLGVRERHPYALVLFPLSLLAGAFCWVQKERELRRLQQIEQALVEAGGDPYVGKLIGEYRVARRIGSGAYGQVYQATAGKSSTVWALKILPYGDKDPDQAATIRARFEREMALLKTLHHDNVGRVIDYGQTPEFDWVLMPLYDGGTLQDKIDLGTLPKRSVLKYAKEIADGLTVVHGLGAFHRDLKPENVMLHNDTAILIDFGMARDTKQGTLTVEGHILGTPLYMAPEQIGSSRVDDKADQYAYGVMVFHMLTGKYPFKAAEGTDPMQILAEKIMGGFLLLRSVEPAQSEKVEAVIARMLSAAPETRFESIEAAYQALENAVREG